MYSVKKNLWFTFSLATLAAMSVGCGSGVNFGLGQTAQTFTQSGSTVKNSLDILWVVDNSNSMDPLQTNMTNNFSSFISSFQSKGYDFRMAVTTTDAYKGDPSFVSYTSANANMAMFRDGTDATSHTGIFEIVPTTPNLNSVFITDATQGAAGSGDERALSSMRTALNSNMNAGFLRSNSFFAVIILSDEDDFSDMTRTEASWGKNQALDHCYVDPTMDAASTTTYSGPTHISTCATQKAPESVPSYVQYLDQLTQSTGSTRRYNVSAITILDNACQAQHEVDTNVAIIGQRYMQLANATQGTLGSICDSSYGNSLAAISSQITTLSTQFFLNTIPNLTTLQVLVNKVLVPQDPANGWTYSSAANSIQFHGNATPAQGASISVLFTPTMVSH